MKEFNHAFFLDEMAAQYSFNAIFDDILSKLHPGQTALSDSGLNEAYRAVPPQFRKYANQIPVRIVQGNVFPTMPYQEKILFEPSKLTIINQFNPKKKPIDDMEPEEVAANSLVQLFNQVGRPQGIIIATQSLESLSGYFVRTFTKKGDDYRGACEVELNFHHQPMVNPKNPGTLTTEQFVMLVAQLIVDANTGQGTPHKTWYTMRK